MDVELPDGTIITDVPEGTTKAQLMARVNKIQPEEPSFSEEHRDALRLGKNLTAGAVGRVVDTTATAPAVLGQLAARAPGWLTQGVGKGVESLGELIGSDWLKEKGEIGQMAGEMANRDIGNFTQKVTGQPFFSAAGLANQAFETALPSTAPRDLKEAGTDALTQIVTGGATLPGKNVNMLQSPNWIRSNIGTLGAGLGAKESIETGDPRWAIAGMVIPTATNMGIKWVANKAASKTPEGKLVDMGYSPSVYASEVGQDVAQDVAGQKQALGMIKEDIGSRINSPAQIQSPNFQAKLRQDLGVNYSPRAVRDFNTKYATLIHNNVAQGRPAELTFDDVADLKEWTRKRFNRTTGENQETFSALQGVVKDMEMNQANAAGEAVNLAKFNRDYKSISKFDEDFVKGADQETSKIFGKLHTAFKNDPDYYASEVAKLSPKIQQDLNSMNMKELGGGNVFDVKKWGKEVTALDPKSRLALAGGDAAKAEQLLTVAQNAEKGQAIINAVAKALNYTAGVSGGWHAYLAARALTNPATLKAISNGVKMSTEALTPAVQGRLVNSIINAIKLEDNYDYSDNTPEGFEGDVTPPTDSDALPPAPEPADSIEGGAGNDKLRITITPPSSVPKDIIQEEGTRLKAYKDTRGNTTVGIGFNMDDPTARKRWAEAGLKTPFQAVKRGRLAITPQEAKQLANHSYKIAANDAKKLYPNFNKLSKNRQQALTNMSYQMGLTKLAEFRDANKAIQNGRFNAAVRHFINSAWAKQTPDRAKRILTMLMKDVPYDEA